MGHHHHHHTVYHYSPSPSQIAEMERQKRLKEENERRLKQLEEEQRKQREENEKKQREKELEEIKKKEEELEKKKKEEEEMKKLLQNQAYYDFIEKCNVISIEKINNLIKLFPNDFTSKYLPDNLFQNCSNYVKSIYNKCAQTYKLEEKLNKILDEFLQNEISKINLINSKINILVIGPSGVGKSTLINEFLELDDENKAEVNDTDSCTMTNKLYESPKFPQFGLIDTRGIEKNLEIFGIQKMIENIKEEISERNRSNDPQNFIHGIWYCINSARFEDIEIECLNELANTYRNSGLPIIIVFTQSLNKHMAEEIERKINNLNNDFLFTRVLAKEKYIDNGIIVPPRGLDKLKEITLKKCSKSYLPAYRKSIEDNIKNSIYRFIGINIKKVINSKNNVLMRKNVVIPLIINEIKSLYNKLGTHINQLSIDIENEINSFYEGISQIFNQRYKSFENNNKNDLFHKLKELNVEMRNSNNNLIRGIDKAKSDSLYKNNAEKLNEKEENFKAEYILNYFIKEFSSFSYENIKFSFLRILGSIYIDKIKQELDKLILV
jgi:GTPase SAR1 family protein